MTVRCDLIISVNSGGGGTDPTIIYSLNPNDYPLCWKTWRLCEHLINITDFELNYLNNCLLIIGGKSGSGRSLSSILYLRIVDQNMWRCDVSLFPARYGCAAAIDDNKFVIIGGCQASNTGKEFESITEMLLCESQPPGESARKRLGDLGSKERILQSADIMFHTKQTNWSLIKPLPYCLMNHAVVFHYGGIYVSGGQHYPGGPPLHITIEYDVVRNDWMIRSDMLFPRVGHKLISYDNTLLAVGGQCLVKDQWCPVYAIEKYDVFTNDWSILTCTPNPRSFVGSALYFGRLFIVAGYNNHNSQFVTDTDIFDLFTHKWHKGPPYPSHHKPKCLVITHAP